MSIGNQPKKSIRVDKIVWKGDPLGIVQKNEIWPYYQMILAQSKTRS